MYDMNFIFINKEHSLQTETEAPATAVLKNLPQSLLVAIAAGVPTVKVVPAPGI